MFSLRLVLDSFIAPRGVKFGFLASTKRGETDDLVVQRWSDGDHSICFGGLLNFPFDHCLFGYGIELVMRNLFDETEPLVQCLVPFWELIWSFTSSFELVRKQRR